MPEQITWPRCTIIGCGHSLTHPDEAALTRAIAEHGDLWVASRSGRATCVCHGYSPRALHHPFPCDQSAVPV